MEEVNKRRFICDNVRKLNKTDLYDLAKSIVRGGYAYEFKDAADGTRINLDNLKDEEGERVVNILYTQIRHKLDKPN